MNEQTEQTKIKSEKEGSAKVKQTSNVDEGGTPTQKDPVVKDRPGEPPIKPK